jgi:hypothetical protein
MRVSSAQGVAQVVLPADAQLPARWSAHERVQVYQRVFGVPGGTGGDAKPSREFNDLWLRFVSSVAQVGRRSPSQSLNASAAGESFRATVRELAAQVGPLGIEYGLAIAAEAYLASGRGAEAGVDATAQAKADNHRLDLSQIVSKYIGETEKNLAVVFERAQRSDAVLLFDEADALFGKRTEVKDSHDRDANVAVNASLQGTEDPERIAVQATNGHEPIDPDVLKRLREPVQLPTPPGPPRSRG